MLRNHEVQHSRGGPAVMGLVRQFARVVDSFSDTVFSRSCSREMAITLLDVIRGKATMDELAPDASYCHWKDRLTPEEVAEIRGCSVKSVYERLKPGPGRKPCLFGPPGKPIRVFGWSVIQFMGESNPPSMPETLLAAKPVASAVTRPRTPRFVCPKSRVVLPYPGQNR